MTWCLYSVFREIYTFSLAFLTGPLNKSLKQSHLKNLLLACTFFKNRLRRSCFPLILWNFSEHLLLLKLFFTVALFLLNNFNPANIYLLRVNKKNSRKRSEICLKLIIKTPEPRFWRCSGVFIVNFGYISHVFLVFLLLILNK